MRFLMGLAAMVMAALQGAAHAEPGNPFLEDWSRNPYGAPPFERIAVAHIMPALEAGIEAHNQELARIASQRARPTFRNTIEAMERAGATLSQSARYYGMLTSAHNTEDLQAVERDADPLLARHQTSVYLNQGLWARVRDLYERRERLRLNAEQQRLLWRYHQNFVRAGANLDESGRARLADIDERLSRLSTQFGQNLLADTAAWTMVLETEADLAGLSPNQRAQALEAGRARGLEGKHVITLQRSSVEPFLTFSARRDLRERAWRAWSARGQNGNEYDNRAIIREMMQLRAEKARLLGYPSFAHYVIEDRVARTPEAANALLMQVWAPARARALEDRAALQTLAAQDGANHPIEAWDWRYYAERARVAQYDVSEEAFRPYLQFDQILQGAFYAAERLFDLRFTEIQNFPSYHPDVRTFEVRDGRGRLVGLYLADPYARPTKQSGAWMNAIQPQVKLGGRRTPIVTNNWNYNRPAPGEPALLSWDDAETIFHEFGHALHGLLSDVTYQTLSGTAVPRDYVEFPSQVLERWFSTEDVLTRFARNAAGEPMPTDLVARLKRAQNFNQGFATVEFLASAIVDMDLHTQTEFGPDFDVAVFEAATLERIGMPREIGMRHRSTHFGHLFQNTYHAGYYGYLWSEVLDADAFGAFVESGDLFDRETAERFRTHIFAAGNSVDPMEAYVRFRGRAPTPEPLMRARGFIGAETPQ